MTVAVEKVEMTMMMTVTAVKGQWVQQLILASVGSVWIRIFDGIRKLNDDQGCGDTLSNNAPDDTLTVCYFIVWEKEEISFGHLELEFNRGGTDSDLSLGLGLRGS